MPTIIAIDPGQAGGIAWHDESGTHAIPMPDTPSDILDALMRTVSGYSRLCYIEKVHSMPGQGVASTYKFGYGVGMLHGCMYACDIPFVEVSPQKWQKHWELPKDKADRKRAIKVAMQARYPELSVTLKTADALAILTWARETQRP